MVFFQNLTILCIFGQPSFWSSFFPILVQFRFLGLTSLMIDPILIILLQTYNKLNDDLQFLCHKHSELILPQNNPLFGLIVVESDHNGIEHPPAMN